MRAVFTQPIEMRVNEMIAGIRADVGVKLFGDDLEVLRAKAAEIQRLVAAVPGAVDVSTEQLTGAVGAVRSRSIVRRSAASASRARDVLRVVEALGGEQGRAS
jgi:cobalt-zinc-cadmium resistance protein CzcA